MRWHFPKKPRDTKKIWKIKIEYYVTWNWERNRSIISAHHRIRSLHTHTGAGRRARGLLSILPMFDRWRKRRRGFGEKMRKRKHEVGAENWKFRSRWARAHWTSHLFGERKAHSLTFDCVGAAAAGELFLREISVHCEAHDIARCMIEKNMSEKWSWSDMTAVLMCGCRWARMMVLLSNVGRAFSLFLCSANNNFCVYLCNIVYAIISSMNQN